MKMSRYFTTFELTRGFWGAFLASAFIYMADIGWSHPLPNTILATLALYLLLTGNPKSWLFSGFFIGIFWFWWIAMSFRMYGFAWAIPIGIFAVALVYAMLFWGAALLAQAAELKLKLPSIWIRALFLLTVSFIHPLGFDWFKPELMFVESYFGIEKWRFALVLLALALTIRYKKRVFLLILLLAYEPTYQKSEEPKLLQSAQIVTTSIPIDDKWEPTRLQSQIDLVLSEIDNAIRNNKKQIIFPESVLPLFLNKEYELLEIFREKSNAITIVLGSLNLEEDTPRNSAYIFKDKKMLIANKVVLVPFGESNPLPEWLGKIVNRIFFDDAVDYVADSAISDYTLGDASYRNAICYEACSERLYEGSPKNMIVLSNNGWFTPSIEPTQQRLLLEYYSRKYGTVIYHSINMSPSYIVWGGKSHFVQNP